MTDIDLYDEILKYSIKFVMQHTILTLKYHSTT